MITVMYRKVTPKGKAGRFGEEHFDDVELAAKWVAKQAPTCCWIYWQMDDIKFPGNTNRKVRTK